MQIQEEIILVIKDDNKYEIEKENYSVAKKEESVWDGKTVDNSIFANYDTQEEFIIMTAEQFKAFQEEVNTNQRTFEGKTVKLGANINMGAKWDDEGNLISGKSWNKIGAKFNGNFDGQNHTISGIYSSGGVFDSVKTLKNLGLINSYISGTYSAGLVVWGAVETIENCYNGATVIGTIGAGGIAGWFDSSSCTIRNCKNYGYIESEQYLGGILGLRKFKYDEYI